MVDVFSMTGCVLGSEGLGASLPRVVAINLRKMCSVATCFLLLAPCGCCQQTANPDPTPPKVVSVDAQQVWIVDDGERVARKAGKLSLMTGESNAVWKPGEPVRLFGLPGETVSFQVVVTAGSTPMHAVTVDVRHLSGPVELKNGDNKNGPAFRPIELFVVHELSMDRRSGGKTKGESLGWAATSVPPDPSRAGSVPDPLIPIEMAPEWADYPMTVASGEHRVVWVDVTLPSQHFPAGTYTSSVEVRSPQGALATIPVSLEVGPVALPYAAVSTMVYFEPERAVRKRTGSLRAVNHFFQLMHRHHLSTVFPIQEESDVRAYADALSGRLYTRENGYSGPGEGQAASVIVLGSYGGYGDPEASKLASIRASLVALDALGLRDDPGKRDVFLYAADEQCDSPVGPGWRKLLDGSGDALLASLRVGHTCSEPPDRQGVDLVMMIASAYEPAAAAAARASGKRVWIYNGEHPQTGSFLTDAWHISLRANGWIQQKYGIERWFYWESVFWNDGNRGGLGPYDPLSRAETFHNAHGDHANGDGVLVYPGKQLEDGYRSLGFDGVIPSIRLKQWRRGIADAGYVQLARTVDSAAADAVVSRVVPRGFGDVKAGEPSWSTRGEAWAVARRELFEIIRRR